jgi:hypothetical protein
MEAQQWWRSSGEQSPVPSVPKSAWRGHGHSPENGVKLPDPLSRLYWRCTHDSFVADLASPTAVNPQRRRNRQPELRWAGARCSAFIAQGGKKSTREEVEISGEVDAVLLRARESVTIWWRWDWPPGPTRKRPRQNGPRAWLTDQWGPSQ